MTSEIYAVRIKEHRGNEISAPVWRVGKYLRFVPAQYEGVHGPGGWATYEACERASATFTDKEGARGIVAFMKKNFPFVICEIRRFVEADDVVA